MMETEKYSEKLFRERSDEAWKTAPDTIDDEKMERMQRDIMSRISTIDDIFAKKEKKRFGVIRTVAAAAAIAIVFAVAGYWTAGRGDEEVFYRIVAENGQKSSISLPDGSTIMLNSGSSITYSSKFNKGNRDIELEGEAFFDVAKNPDLPFVVHANEMDVTALGTKFNVRAYENDNKIVATLVQGRIRTEADGKSEVLTPNNMARYDRVSRKLTSEKVIDTEAATAWTENRIVFDDEPLEEIGKRLERLYDVEVVFADETCRKERFNGRVRNNSLENILSMIGSTAPIQYSFDGDTVEFSTRR